MIRWICGTKLEDETPSANLLKKLDIADISAVLRGRRLRWAGHVQRATSCIKTDFSIPGVRGRGRPRKTWRECVRKDEEECGLSGADPQDRVAWRAGVRRGLVLLTPSNGTGAAP